MKYYTDDDNLDEEERLIAPDIVKKSLAVTTRTDQTQFTYEERERLIAQIADLYVTGQSLTEISHQLRVHRSTVVRYTKILAERWLEHADKSFAVVRAREIAKLDRVEHEAWRAWERSCQKVSEEKTTARDDDDGITRINRTTTKKESGGGDPRFLDMVFKCVDRRLKLYGIDPTNTSTIEATVHDQNPDQAALFAQYAAVFAKSGDLTVLESAPAAADHLVSNRDPESVDSESSPSQAGRVPDPAQR